MYYLVAGFSVMLLLFLRKLLCKAFFYFWKCRGGKKTIISFSAPELQINIPILGWLIIYRYLFATLDNVFQVQSRYEASRAQLYNTVTQINVICFICVLNASVEDYWVQLFCYLVFSGTGNMMEMYISYWFLLYYMFCLWQSPFANTRDRLINVTDITYCSYTSYIASHY